jgi:hypothetical protein
MGNYLSYVASAMAVSKGEIRTKQISKKTFSDMLYDDHSPVRFAQFFILAKVPYFVAIHLKTHAFQVCVIESQRHDINGKDRDPKREALISMNWNAKTFLNVAEKRLCKYSASKETYEFIEMIKSYMIKHHPEIGQLMKKSCEVKGKCRLAKCEVVK